jgi:uncharacterized protein
MPSSFHVMAKPTGAQCNLDCSYCFFLKKMRLYPESDFRMTDEVHEAYIRQLFEAHREPLITVAWQGGEPSLMGIDFFRRSVELQKKYRKPGTVVENTFQTNGILLDEVWCRFFRENKFLVGLSMDGPKELHDAFRKDKGGHGTFDRVMKAVRLLQDQRVEFNILCTVNSRNASHPLPVYRFFRDTVKSRYIQFIPVVERIDDNILAGARVTERSVRPEQWGKFLIGIFDEWVGRDVGRTFVLNFDGALAGWLGMAGTVCIFWRTCGRGMALEHNGDLYSCDHFVEPGYLLGNIMQTPMSVLADSPKQLKFGRDKWDRLPGYCRRCEFIFACHGECPRNRFIETPDGEDGLNYLCQGYRSFFEHAGPKMKIMAELIRNGRLAGNVMSVPAVGKVRKGRNDPCSCGSGLKVKHCHDARI